MLPQLFKRLGRKCCINLSKNPSHAFLYLNSRWEWWDPGWGSPVSTSFRISIYRRVSFQAQDQELEQPSLGWVNLEHRQAWHR